MDKNKLILSISILLGCVVLGGIYYATEIYKQKLVVKQNTIPEEVRVVGELNQNLNVNTPVEKSLQNTNLDSKKSNVTQRVSTQLNAFDDYLEYNLVGADVDCTVYATYNNQIALQQSKTETFKLGFPENRETYENKCRSSYVDVAMNKYILVAEPELQNLRIILSSYTDEVISFAQYALGGGSAGSVIDMYSSNMKNYRTKAREEVVRLKRQYSS